MSSDTKLKKFEKIKRKKNNPPRKIRKSQTLKIKMDKFDSLNENEKNNIDKMNTIKNHTLKIRNFQLI